MDVRIIKFDELGHFKVFVDDLLHLKIAGLVNAIHSYIDETSRQVPDDSIAGIPMFKTVTYPMYYINFHLASGQTVKCEYNRRDLWEAILKGL